MPRVHKKPKRADSIPFIVLGLIAAFAPSWIVWGKCDLESLLIIGLVITLLVAGAFLWWVGKKGI